MNSPIGDFVEQDINMMMPGGPPMLTSASNFNTMPGGMGFGNQPPMPPGMQPPMGNQPYGSFRPQ